MSYDFLTENMIQKNLLPVLHAGINTVTNSLTISIQNSFTYKELILNFIYIIGLFTKIKSKINPKVDVSLAEKDIKYRATSYNKKQLLKILLDTDPRLFSGRKIGKALRPYSGLAQKQEQRVVPITKDEYEIIKKVTPESVINLKNQTYPDQRLYLYCPYNQTKYVNFHSIPGQLCIVRCTTKLSNKSQVLYCTNQLDALGVQQVNYKYENQSLTLYNALITKGRKCKVPSEMEHSFGNYILVKL